MHLRRRTWVAALALLLVLTSFAAFAQAESITVQPGDTLRSIAARAGTSVEALVQANNLADPDVVQAGQTLILPPRGSANPAAGSSGSAAGQSAPATAATPAPVAGRYVVRVGDTLNSIAARYGTTALALVRANGIANPDFLAAGTVLVIPRPGVVIAPSPRPTATPATTSAGAPAGVTGAASPTKAASTATATSAASAKSTASPADAVAAAGAANPSGKPAPRPSGRFVVSISKQHCWLYQDDVETGSWPCSTGRKGWGTATGTFHVKSKIPVAYGSTWNFYMPHWLGIYNVGTLENGIHGLPFRGNFHDWGNKIGTPISFGCVVLQDAAAKKVYDAAYIGMPVVIKR